MCETMFSNIPSNGREIPQYPGNPYPKAVPQQYTVQTVKEMKLLKLRFLLPGSMKYFREKPVSVIKEIDLFDFSKFCAKFLFQMQ